MLRCSDIELDILFIFSPLFQAIDVLCGSGSGECTPQGWLNFMGNGSNSPFDLYFQITDKPISFTNYNNTVTEVIPLNETIHKCSKSPALGKPACSCQVSRIRLWQSVINLFTSADLTYSHDHWLLYACSALRVLYVYTLLISSSTNKLARIPKNRFQNGHYLTSV